MGEMIRTAALKLTYDGVDISADVSSYLTGFTVTSALGGKADDLQVNLENISGNWTGSWFPSKGATLKAAIKTDFSGQKKSLNCGTFSIDEITAAGPPDTVTIKGVSSLTTKNFKREKKCRAWENMTLPQIAADIAEAHSLSLWIDADDPPSYTREDQREESDLAFLNRLCKDEDLNLKVTGEKIVISTGKNLEDLSPVATLQRGVSFLSQYSFETKTFDVYKACKIKYFDPVKKQEQTYTFTPPNAPDVGQTLQVNQRVESLAQAQKRAKGALRRKNRQEITADFTIMGDPDFQAGLTITVAGFGAFDGKYLIEESSHTYSRGAGYQTAVKARKTLGW
jgi:hypothetical protein